MLLHLEATVKFSKHSITSLYSHENNPISKQDKYYLDMTDRWKLIPLED